MPRFLCRLSPDEPESEWDICPWPFLDHIRAAEGFAWALYRSAEPEIRSTLSGRTIYVQAEGESSWSAFQVEVNRRVVQVDLLYAIDAQKEACA